jgi:uncharacterized membrane protein YqaE (UPF0057 family)
VGFLRNLLISLSAPSVVVGLMRGVRSKGAVLLVNLMLIPASV